MKTVKNLLTALALAVVLCGVSQAGGYRTRVTFSTATYATPAVALAQPACTSGVCGVCGVPALQTPFQAPLNYGAAGGCGVAPVQTPLQAPFQSAYGVQAVQPVAVGAYGVGAYGVNAFGAGHYGVNTFGFRSRAFTGFSGYGVGVRTFGAFGGVGVRRGVAVQVAPFRGVRVIRFR